MSASPSGGDIPVRVVVHGLDKSADRPRTRGTLCYLCRALPSASSTGGDNQSTTSRDTDGDLSSVTGGMSTNSMKDTGSDPLPATTCDTLSDNKGYGLDITRLACLWSQQELCGRRPAKCDPFEWACQEGNIDSFVLFARLKRLPRVPTFAQAVMQQRQAIEDEVSEAEIRKSNAAHNAQVARQCLKEECETKAKPRFPSPRADDEPKSEAEIVQSDFGNIGGFATKPYKSPRNCSHEPRQKPQESGEFLSVPLDQHLR